MLEIRIRFLRLLQKINGRLAGGLLIHVLVWLCFMVVSAQLLGFDRGYSKNLWNTVLFFIIQIFFFYANSYYWLPKVFSAEKGRVRCFIWLLVAQIFCLVVFLVVISMLFGNLRISFAGSFNDWLLIPYNLSAFVLPFMAYWPFSTGYYYLVQSKAVSVENRRLRHETMLLSQRWLKAELNPHFMNNCYHFLDGLLLIDVKKAEEGLVLIQNMMQYYLLVPKDGFIEVKDELDQCKRLMKLYRLRYGDIFVSVQMEKEVAHLPCLPMCLVLLMENLLKYGVVNQREEAAELKLTYKDGILEITTFNKIRHSGQIPIAGTGRGLANLESQLQHFYPNAFVLSRKEENGVYQLQLRIWVENSLGSGIVKDHPM
ncbi:histidine kinase [Olivibacter sp. CPCC 100613]|uniref:histidine kinase n=1 Tax=Olivibacter sp. CPCC 100613 TaxID=3079931 RepID=UPI002FF53110